LLCSLGKLSNRADQAINCHNDKERGHLVFLKTDTDLYQFNDTTRCVFAYHYIHCTML